MESEYQVQELVTQAQAGDVHCAGKLFDLYMVRIFRFLCHRMPTNEAAEDLSQTVFLEMVKSLHRYNPQRNAKFSTWLFQIARHRLVDFYRRRRQEVSLEDIPEPVATITWMDPVGYDGLHQAVAALPERYGTVLNLRYQEDLSAAEIAQIMNTSEINVRVLQHRALKALRGVFKVIPATQAERFAAELP
jgi:RNA polymerase sigma-70 factor (ECF subfamily)